MKNNDLAVDTGVDHDDNNHHHKLSTNPHIDEKIL